MFGLKMDRIFNPPCIDAKCHTEIYFNEKTSLFNDSSASIIKNDNIKAHTE